MNQIYALPESLSIPYDGVDAEHGSLIVLLNQALDVAETIQDNRQAMKCPLDALSNAMLAHFAHEEQEMETLGYAELPQHRLYHTRCVTKLGTIRESISVNGANKAVLDRVFDLLIDDIIRADSAFKSFLYAAGLIR